MKSYVLDLDAIIERLLGSKKYYLFMILTCSLVSRDPPVEQNWPSDKLPKEELNEKDLRFLALKAARI